MIQDVTLSQQLQKLIHRELVQVEAEAAVNDSIHKLLFTHSDDSCCDQPRDAEFSTRIAEDMIRCAIFRRHRHGQRTRDAEDVDVRVSRRKWRWLWECYGIKRKMEGQKVVFNPIETCEKCSAPYKCRCT